MRADGAGVPGSGDVEGSIMALPEQRAADGGENVVVVVVPDVERQVAIDALQIAGAIQGSRPAGADAVLQRVFGEMLDDVAGAAAGELCLILAPRLPEPRDVPQPQVGGLDV